MSIVPPRTLFQRANTHRLIPSRYPPIGIFDAVSRPEDLLIILELEGWTNDRISAELGVLQKLPAKEWVIGRPLTTIIMAAYCHPHPTGARFNDGDRGAWYAGITLETAHAEAIYHRTKELDEIGVYDTRVEMRQYLADFDGEFHDIRADNGDYLPLYDRDSYAASQSFANELLADGSNGILYRSVRQGGDCIVCFRPALILNVRQGAHFEYRWQGKRDPAIRELRT